MAGHRLYVDVFTQYGPFYNLLNWLLSNNWNCGWKNGKEGGRKKQQR